MNVDVEKEDHTDFNVKSAVELDVKSKEHEEQRKAKRNLRPKTDSVEEKMHDIQKTITLDDLTNPDKN